ncbi:phage GP46 family protein [uncultured Kiloniella sp.]|uniref:phage GP46 family protein n=1 Tax=uncultured Kiloniella sp. TaxID=1133091 RepID=UPI002630CA5B|nr:phage GP46 family protein [uncultured Kiloniella sp.]
MDARIIFDGQLLTGDLALSEGDLETDEGLQTAVVLSLFTDKRAPKNTELPAGETDRRGWWGDLLNENQGDQIGSLRWLYLREKQTTETLNKIIEADQQALDWLVEDGVARKVVVTGEWIKRGLLAEKILIKKPDGTQSKFSYQTQWDSQTTGPLDNG